MTLQPVAFFPDNQLRVIRRSDPRAGRLLSTQSNRHRGYYYFKFDQRLSFYRIRHQLVVTLFLETSPIVRYFSIFIEQTSRYILDYVRPMDRCRISLRPAIKFGPFRRENIRTNSQDAACDRPPSPPTSPILRPINFFSLYCVQHS